MTEHVTRDYTGNMWLYWNDLVYKAPRSENRFYYDRSWAHDGGAHFLLTRVLIKNENHKSSRMCLKELLNKSEYQLNWEFKFSLLGIGFDWS